MRQNQNGSDWVQFRRWSRRGFASLALSFIFLILIPSILTVNDSWCQHAYGVGAFFLFLAFVLLGRAILSLEIVSDSKHRS